MRDLFQWHRHSHARCCGAEFHDQHLLRSLRRKPDVLCGVFRRMLDSKANTQFEAAHSVCERRFLVHLEEQMAEFQPLPRN